MPSTPIREPGQRTPAQRSFAARAVYATLGILFLSLGVAGYILPGLPGTPLLLVSAWLFSMSNDRLYTWMTTNRWFGQTVADYRAGLGISRRTKTVAIASMAIVAPISLIFGPDEWVVRSLVVAGVIAGIVFVSTRPTRESTPETV